MYVGITKNSQTGFGIHLLSLCRGHRIFRHCWNWIFGIMHRWLGIVHEFERHLEITPP